MSGLISSLGNTVGSAVNSIGNMFTGNQSTAQTAAGLANPVASQQPQYQAMLSELLNNPSSVTKLPGYQFNLQQGLGALQSQEAATGNLSSGGADIAAVQYGQNYATSAFNNYEQMLAQLGGFTSANPGAAASAYTSAMNGDTSGTGGIGSAVSVLGLQQLFGGGSGATTAASTAATSDLGASSWDSLMAILP